MQLTAHTFQVCSDLLFYQGPTIRAHAGNLWLQTGDEKVDVGLCVKHGAKGMCVPDYVQAQPDNNGWAYSQALVTVIEQYKVGPEVCAPGC